MNFNLIRKQYQIGGILPECIDNYLYEQYKTADKRNLKRTLSTLFSTTSNVDYGKKVMPYTFYYFPLNFFKVWKPLVDLSERNQIKNNIKVLEIGCGSGSATFGLIDFYTYLAKENIGEKFSIQFTLIEQHQEFVYELKTIFEIVKNNIPPNLTILISEIQVCSIKENLNCIKTFNFDIVLASNVFNYHEKNGTTIFEHIVKAAGKKIDKNGSIILIEPAKQNYSIPFLQARNDIVADKELNIYSPCCAIYEGVPHELCTSFSMARAYIKKANILSKLYKDKVADEKFEHAFQYVVLRKDGLVKYDFVKKKHTCLCDIASKQSGEKVNIYANIVSTNIKKGETSLLLCDGSLGGKRSVWLNLTNTDLKQHQIDGELIKGEMIVLQNAIVQDTKNLGVDIKTKMEVKF